MEREKNINKTKTQLFVEEPLRYTDVPILQSTLVALIGGSLTLFIAYILKGQVPYIYELIHQRGAIQYLTVFFFWFAVGMLIFKWIKIRKQIGAFDLPYVKEFTKGREEVGFKTIISEHAKLMINIDPKESKYLLVNRINKAIKQLMVSKDPAQVSQVLSTVSSTDSAIIDTSYIPIKFMIWLIPILGFLGTVIGMSKSISSFNLVLQNLKDVGFQGIQVALANVTSGLGVAFDTTFLALILAVIVNFFSNTLQKKEENFLSDVEDFVTENIVNKLRVKEEAFLAPEAQPQVYTNLQEVMNELARELKNLSKQSQYGTEQLQEQLGRVVESLKSGSIEKGSQPELTEALRDFADALTKNKDSLKALARLSDLLNRTSETVENLKTSVEEMTKINRKLGELFGKIYKTKFL